MRENLEAALAFILRWEGGFAERTNEPGGGVNHGVSMQAYRAWRAKHNQPAPTIDDLRAMSVDEAKEIFTADYADPIGFGRLAPGLDLAALDSAVNEGVGFTKRALAAAGPAPITYLCDLRLSDKQKRPDWPRFGHGWTNRIEACRKLAVQMSLNAIKG